MHIPTPHLHKTDKRKASIDSVAHSDHSATQHVEPKPVKTKKKATKRRAKKMKVKKEDREKTPENVDVDADSDANNHPLYSSSPAAVSEPVPSSPPLTTTTSQQESPPTDAQPRRSSRLRNSLSNVSATWDKCRPYIERINGTIMPLEPQGTKAYYARDGIKVD